MIMISATGIGLAGEVGELHHRRGCPACLAVIGNDCGKYAATHVEARRQSHVARLRGACQIVQDAVGDFLVKAASVAEGPDIELQALEFDTGLVRNVIEKQGRKIRLAGFWAQTGEFRDFHVNMEIPLRRRIGKGFEGAGRCDGHGHSEWHPVGNESGRRSVIISAYNGIPQEYSRVVHLQGAG
ncbi:MAG: hypothetical protein CAPSK01_003220 [Candidatus Accumulibacter vicinus]|uniref:Uncharacterized protein n=1 Tax=Candidatus Accumulibacter vicinus TaxID=2954382 RepID=A0A084XYB6_9PROT|nr:MAG: hypothetical protein CAPSK01_003220 [Candidatus Accumulibacter vicinus]